MIDIPPRVMATRSDIAARLWLRRDRQRAALTESRSLEAEAVFTQVVRRVFLKRSEAHGFVQRIAIHASPVVGDDDRRGPGASLRKDLDVNLRCVRRDAVVDQVGNSGACVIAHIAKALDEALRSRWCVD